MIAHLQVDNSLRSVFIFTWALREGARCFTEDESPSSLYRLGQRRSAEQNGDRYTDVSFPLRYI